MKNAPNCQLEVKQQVLDAVTLMWQQAVVLNVWITSLQLAVTEAHGYQTSFTFSLLKCSKKNLKNCPGNKPM